MKVVLLEFFYFCVIRQCSKFFGISKHAAYFNFFKVLLIVATLVDLYFSKWPPYLHTSNLYNSTVLTQFCE